MKKITGVLCFVLGAGVGAFATYKLVEKHFKDIADEEIKSVIKKFKEREKQLTSKISVETSGKTDAKRSGRLPWDAYNKPITPESLGYNNAAVEEKPKYISIISPDEFGEYSDYETVSLTYYADGVLTDQMDNIIDNVEDYVGKGFETHFGEYEDDSVFVRNDDKAIDFEILRDNRTYQEVVLGEKP